MKSEDHGREIVKRLPYVCASVRTVFTQTALKLEILQLGSSNLCKRYMARKVGLSYYKGLISPLVLHYY